MHHAHLIIGSYEAAQSLLPLHAQQSNEDCQIAHYDVFTIADAREIRYQASLQAFGEGRTFVLHIRSITAEAQHALLKVFEDPQRAVVFYVIASSEDMFLPTVRSRFITSYTYQSDPELNTDTLNAFLSSSYGERIRFVQDLVSQKDTDRITSFVRSLESVAHITKDRSLMKEVCDSATYRFDRSVSQKMLLEHIALSFPIIKK